MRKTCTWLAAAFVLITSCTKTANDEIDLSSETAVANKKKESAIAQINFSSPNLFPEGVVYDPFNDRFYVSSVTSGDIGIVSADGSYTPFITDADLTGTTGLEIDKARKRLYVSNSPGGVGVYDINTGERIHFINLSTVVPGAPVFINDIALDPQGNAYVTNSLSPIIYKITPDGVASIFFREPSLALAPGQFGFNGIEYGNSGYLLVSYTNNNRILKIPVSDPSLFSSVALDVALNRPDGLLLSNDGKQLIVVNNAGGAAGAVLSFSTDDKWTSGSLSSSFSTGAVFPTTATSNGKNVFVLYAYLNRRAIGQSAFTIQEVPLETARPF